MIKEILSRLKAKTPKFFVQLQKILLAFSFVAGIGMTQLEQLPNWSWLEDFLRIGIFCGLFGTFIAQLTKDTSNLNQDNK